MAPLWSTRESFFLPRNQRLHLMPVFVLTMMSRLLVTGGAETRLTGQVGGIVSFCCPVDLRHPVEFLYLQKKKPLEFVNGYHARIPVPNPWKNTRVDKDNKTVHMFDLNISHQGEYECLVDYDGNPPSSKTSMILSITANYTKPAITMLSCDENLCSAKCSSHGGYPRSKITWNVPETQALKEVNHSNPVEDPVTWTFNISSIVQFNCSQGEIEMVSCSVGGMDSERLSVCASKDSPPFSDNIILIAVAVTAVATVVAVVFIIRVCRMRNAKKRQEAANAHVAYKLANENELAGEEPC